MQAILFYGEKNPWGEFSNFYPAILQINGKTYPTSEHFYQAFKFLGPDPTERELEYAELIRVQSTPNKAKILARQQVKGGYAWVQPLNDAIRNYPDVKVRPDLEQVKDNLMRWAVFQKFFQHHYLFEILHSTGNALLVEHTNRDKYWADNIDGTGKNMLGRILVETRELLRRHLIPTQHEGHFWVLNQSILIRRSSGFREYPANPGDLPSTGVLNQLRVSSFFDLSGRNRLVKYIFGVSTDETRYEYGDRLVFYQHLPFNEMSTRLIEDLGKQRISYLEGDLEELRGFLPHVWSQLYHISFETAQQLTVELLN